jgi:hypothetical protein
VRQLRQGRSEVSAAADGSSSETSTFTTEFKANIDAGTGQPSRVRWKPKPFCDALRDAKVGGVGRPTEKTFNHWYNGVHVPRSKAMIDAMEKVFWGDDTTGDACARFRRSWEVASETPRPSLPPRPPSGPAPLLEARSSRRPGNLALLDLTVEATSQGSSADDFGMLVDMRHGVDPFEETGAAFGLSRLTIRYEESGCQPSGDRYADKGTVDGVKPIAGGWEFIAKPGDVLDGRRLEVLARFLRTEGTDSPAVTLQATSHTDDLRPVLNAELATLPGKVKGILGRYLANRKYARKGTIALGSASLRWGPK